MGLTFPSLYEGFGLPIVEAFACSCPVLTSNIGSMAEVADFAALLVDPLDVKSISFGLKKLASDDKLRQKLIGKGQSRIQDFSWEKAARETLQVFEKVYQQK